MPKKVVICNFCIQKLSQRQHRGPSYQRRQARRRQNAQVNTVEGCEDAEEAAVANHVAVVADEVIDKPADKAADKMCDITELNECKVKIQELTSKIVELEQEVASKMDTIAVNDMRHEDFKERVKDKYLYDSEDELSDYQSDEESRKLLRQEFWKKKLIANDLLHGVPTKMDKFACTECDFVSKSEPGLKTHTRKKH